MAYPTKWTPEVLEKVTELSKTKTTAQMANYFNVQPHVIERVMTGLKIKTSKKRREDPEYFNWGDYPHDAIFVNYTNPAEK